MTETTIPEMLDVLLDELFMMARSSHCPSQFPGRRRGSWYRGASWLSATQLLKG